MGSRIFHRAGLASCCRSRLSSNVRHHKVRCVPSAAQNSRMHSRPHSSHPSGAATDEVPRLRRNMLAVRFRSKNCSKKLRASRAAIVVPEAVVVVQFIKPAAGAAQEGHFQSDSCTTARLGNRGEKAVANPTSVASSYAVMPNTSLEARPNGRPPGPVWRYAVHFRQPGPRVPPSVPA